VKNTSHGILGVVRGFGQPTHELFIHDTKVCLKDPSAKKQDQWF